MAQGRAARRLFPDKEGRLALPEKGVELGRVNEQ
jgi:hypothetical protein